MSTQIVECANVEVRKYCWIDQVRHLQLSVTDVRFDALNQLRRHFADAVFLGVFIRCPKYLYIVI